MTTTTDIDLKPFCAKELGRYTTNEPWVCNGWRYATDGRICVRVLTTETNSPKPEAMNYPPAADLFAAANHNGCDVPFPYDVPLHEEMGRCPECDGCGRVGEVTECHKCGACTGGDECDTCEGSGESLVPAPVVVGGFAIKRSYYEAISKLPNVKCGAPVGLNRPMPFVFDGGEGLTMPLPTNRETVAAKL